MKKSDLMAGMYYRYYNELDVTWQVISTSKEVVVRGSHSEPL